MIRMAVYSILAAFVIVSIPGARAARNTAKSYDGIWTGTLSNGETIEFVIADGHLARVSYSVAVTEDGKQAVHKFDEVLEEPVPVERRKVQSVETGTLHSIKFRGKEKAQGKVVLNPFYHPGDAKQRTLTWKAKRTGDVPEGDSEKEPGAALDPKRGRTAERRKAEEGKKGKAAEEPEEEAEDAAGKKADTKPKKPDVAEGQPAADETSKETQPDKEGAGKKAPPGTEAAETEPEKPTEKARAVVPEGAREKLKSGMAKQDMIDLLGEPRWQVGSGAKETVYYEFVKVKLTAGEVSRVDWLVPAEKASGGDQATE